jgi:3-hydroxybutyryl-CoA dehydrogenase
MGPCELMDLIGHDTNLAVTESVYQASFGDKRFVPSQVQRELVAGGLLGRKSGQGFYDYTASATGSGTAATPAPAVPVAPWPDASDLVLHGTGAMVERWVAALTAAGCPHERQQDAHWSGLSAAGGQLRLTDGRPAAQVAFEEHIRDLALFDATVLVNIAAPAGSAIAWSAAASSSAFWQAQAGAWLGVAGLTPQRVADAAGLVVARTVAMLINEAADALQQGVCTEAAADVAMKLGVNYPAGPFEWLARWDAGHVVHLLDHLDSQYRGERYRVSPWLRQRAWQRGFVS